MPAGVGDRYRVVMLGYVQAYKSLCSLLLHR